jgi:hypothetical protein
MTISLRPFRQDDQEFIFRLYASARLGEIASFGWPEAQQETFLRMQFEARYRSYESAYGKAEHEIVEQDGRSIGRVTWSCGKRISRSLRCLANIVSRASAADCFANSSSNAIA